ncbi:hypothetical protein BGZ72_005522 [Mortierella alpina]|nr:hypothetical protein BGZ72_005522 [Mortierella alpina]
MQTQRIRLSSASAEEVIEVRSTANGDHYCHVRDIQHALEFETLATYKVDGVSIEYLADDDGNPGTTRLDHFPDKVIEVTPCEPVEPSVLGMLPRPVKASIVSVAAAIGFPSSSNVTVENTETTECLADSSQKERPTTVQNNVHQEKPQRTLKEPQERTADGFQRDDEANKVIQAELQSIKSQVKKILRRDYKLEECPLPPLFIILPDHKVLGKDTPDLKNLSHDKFRLHFVCEGGPHCLANKHSSTASSGEGDSHRQENKHNSTSSSGGPEDCVHWVQHEGYELLRPDEFCKTFGRYVLGMLRLMRESEGMSDRLVQAGKDTTSMIKLKSSMGSAINYLESKLGHNASYRLNAPSGAELRHLETFLHKKDQDIFGNLWRLITPEASVKWVCKQLSNEGHQLKENFLQLVKTNNCGNFQENLRHLTLSLKDFKLATMLLGNLSKLPFIIELSLELNWDFNMADLDWIVKRLKESSVLILNLDLKDDKAIFILPKTRLLSMRKYQPLQQLYQHQPLLSFRLAGASRFGIRTSSHPDTTKSNLRTLHFKSRFDCREDQQVLQNIIKNCSRLVDLRLRGVYKSEMSDTVAGAIGGLKQLEILHLHGMEKSGSGGVTKNMLKRLRESRLRELVLVNSPMDAMETMELIKNCEQTLEVLVLDLAVFQPLNLTSILPDRKGSHLDDYQLLRNLKSLHLHVSDDFQSVRRLAKTLQGLSLTHLGLSQQNSQGIKNSLEGKSLLHSVNFGSLQSLFLSGFSGSCLDPLWGSVKESAVQKSRTKSPASSAIRRTLESLSLEFLHNCPDLAKKLNRLALKSLWVIADVEQLQCEVNQLALGLDLSTLKNVALFKTKRPTIWYGLTLTERPLSKLDVGKYFEGIEKHLKAAAEHDLTMRVGEMIVFNNKLDQSILSALSYRVQYTDIQTRIVQGTDYVWRLHNPRYHRYQWGWSDLA